MTLRVSIVEIIGNTGAFVDFRVEALRLNPPCLGRFGGGAKNMKTSRLIKPHTRQASDGIHNRTRFQAMEPRPRKVFHAKLAGDGFARDCRTPSPWEAKNLAREDPPGSLRLP